MICSYCSHICGVMATVLASSVVDHGFAGADPWGGGLKLEKIWFFGVKSWFFTRNTSKMFAPPAARRNFFKFTPPPLTWNPGSAPGSSPGRVKLKTLNSYLLLLYMNICCCQFLYSKRNIYSSLSNQYIPVGISLIIKLWSWCIADVFIVVII